MIFRIYGMGLLEIGETPCFSNKKVQYSYHQTLWVVSILPLTSEDSEFWLLHLENLTTMIRNIHDWTIKQTFTFPFNSLFFFWVVHLCEISGPPTKSFSKRLATNHPKRAAFSEAPRIAPGGENSAWAGRKPPRSKHRRCERLTGNLAKVWLEMAWGVGGLMSPIFRHEFNLGHLEGVKSHRNRGDETDDHHG